MRTLISLLLLASLVACAPKDKVSPEEAAKRAGLRREQYSGEATGSNTVTSGDGSTTAILPESDLGSFGLKLYPNAKAKDGNAFRRTTDLDSTVLYTLETGDAPAEVVEFYEDVLKSKATKTGSAQDYIVSGKVGEKSAVVTVLEQDSGSRIEVQIIEGK